MSLLGIVLEGREHLGGIDCPRWREFGGCPIRIAALFDEAFMASSDAARHSVACSGVAVQTLPGWY